jgi:hypothetical protein
MRFCSKCLLALPLLLSCERAGPPASAEVRPVDYTIDQRIGSAMADDQTEFGQISGMTRDAAGRLYIADVQAAQVKVFAPDGSFRYAIGRKGAGPGELANPCCVAVDGQGRVWVRDGENARYSVYQPGDTAASYVTQVRMQHSDVNRFATVSFEPSGDLIDIGTRADSAGANQTHRFTVGANGSTTRDVTVPLLPAESADMKIITRTIPGGTARMYMYQPYGALQLVAHGPNGEWAHAVNARYAIDWRQADGTLIRHITGDIVQGPELTPEERTAAEERLLNDQKRLGQDPGFKVPPRKQPVRALYFDSKGRLWVELSVAGNTSRRAQIYDRTGARVAEFSWPAEANLSYGVVSGDTIWGVAADSLGVQSIVRLIAK